MYSSTTGPRFAPRAPALVVQRAARGLRHALEAALEERWHASAPDDRAAMAASCGGWGAGAALLRAPTERVLQLADADVHIAVRERLSVPLAGDGPCGLVSRLACSLVSVGIRPISAPPAEACFN